MKIWPLCKAVKKMLCLAVGNSDLGQNSGMEFGAKSDTVKN